MQNSYHGIPIYDANGFGGDTIPACPINAYSALTVSAYWRAINFLASNLATFPRSVRLNGAPLDDPHPLDAILERRPNQYQTATTFYRTLFAHAAHRGNGYAEIRRDGGRVTLHNMLPEDVAPFRYDDGKGIGQYYYHAPTRRILPSADVIHLSGSTSYDGMAGLDPTRVHAETFQRAKTLDRHLTRYLSKGTVLRGAIEIPGEVSPEKLEQIGAKLATYFRGSEADRDVIVLSNGAKLNNATLSPQESQIIEQGAHITKAFAQITGVAPVHLFEFSEQKYRGNPEQDGQDVVRFTFRPWVEQTEDEFSAKLLTEAQREQGYTVHLDPDALARGDTAAQTAAAVALSTAGIITKNEARNELGRPPSSDPDADKLKTLGDSTPPKAAPSTPTPPAKSSAPTGTAFAALKPILDAAVARVEAKATKAFANKADATGQARTVWGNVFAEEQGRHVADVLAPIVEALKALDGPTLDVAAVASRYSGAIRKQAATGEAADLARIIDRITKGEPSDDTK